MARDQWFQVEFFSKLSKRWVPLMGKEDTKEAAEAKRLNLLGDTMGRVVKVTQTVEIITTSEGE
jgi:hypothetical protein